MQIYLASTVVTQSFGEGREFRTTLGPACAVHFAPALVRS